MGRLDAARNALKGAPHFASLLFISLFFILGLPSVSAWSQNTVSQKPEVLVIPSPPAQSEFEHRISGFRVFVRKIDIQGADPSLASALQRIARPFEGRFLDSHDLRELPAALNREMQARGYLLGMAEVPDHEIVDGTLRVQCVIGHI